MSENSAEDIILTKDLVKNFKLDRDTIVKVLTGVNMRIKKGEFVAIMGPSGSGKSTLVNILSTLETITDGDVYIVGTNLKELTNKEYLEIRRKTSSIVFQNFSLISYLTALENVKLPMILRGEDDETATRKAIAYLENVGLYGRMHHLPEQLSGGEQQRVAIARALAHEPDIIYCDEPSGNLDTVTGREIISLFKQLSKEKNITVVMVTHDHEAAKQTDRLYILRNGKLAEEQISILNKRRGERK
ncbi:MAG: ABC transporter ATP-binding protein [Candidatus Heimdallarchaeum aukensis]|uniref:ABC transporter ATP-binding protein n=1 Tax=Candidatus Heimdallarchaeum aukensis TaxID=2876573 RepID=A0A9Y1BMI9_9ARCH|nr:MAG: ABC transporter ATP-binding protein [Candidatus Heimdallarchaeum aukensis]